MSNVMAAQPNKPLLVAPSANVLCNSIPCTTPQSLADPAAGVPRSKAANIGERKTWTQSELCSWQNSVSRQKPQKCIYGVPAQ